MIRRPPRSTRPDTLFPYPTLFRSIRIIISAEAGRRLNGKFRADSPIKSDLVRIHRTHDLVVARKFYHQPARQSIRVRAIAHINDYPAGFRDELFDIGRSEDHTSELQSLIRISYPVFYFKKH